MGWQRSTLTLEFDPSTDFDGLHVEMRRLNTGQILDASMLVDNRPGRGAGLEALALYLKRVQHMVADGLILWNYEDHAGNAVPATEDGVSTCDIDMLMAILAAWVDVAVMPSGPLGRTSSDGPPSQEAPPLPMDVHLPNPQSLPEHD
jgi:hypothetical protein